MANPVTYLELMCLFFSSCNGFFFIALKTKTLHLYLRVSLLPLLPPSSLAPRHVQLLQDQSVLWINFAASALCDKMSSKTRGAWIITLERFSGSSPPHLPSATTTRCFRLWETSDVNLAAPHRGQAAKFSLHHGTIQSLLAEDQWASVPRG